MMMFAIDRTPEGYPKLSLPTDPMPSDRQIFENYCFMRGFTEPDTVARLWREEQERRRAALAADRKR